MRKIVQMIALLSAVLSAQDITVSKDSILVYNNPVSSFADWVLFTSHSSSPIHLDSAFIKIDEIDTVGLGDVISQKMLETTWKGNSSSAQEFVWRLDSVGPGDYRLVKKVFYPTTAEPLAFTGTGDSCQIFFLEIGYCFQCALMPTYPRYFKGRLILHFSNGQVIGLRLLSTDLRSTVRCGTFNLDKGRPANSNFGYRINGQRISIDEKTNYRKNSKVPTCLPGKQR